MLVADEMRRRGAMELLMGFLGKGRGVNTNTKSQNTIFF